MKLYLIVGNSKLQSCDIGGMCRFKTLEIMIYYIHAIVIIYIYIEVSE